MQRCTNCVLTETYPGLGFDDQGVCTLCSGRERPPSRGKARLQEYVSRHKDDRSNYDCIVAISGGRDSAFAAHYARRVLGLRILGYTFDNGFMPERTRKNVENVVDSLGIDHVLETSDRVRKQIGYTLSSWMHQPSPAMIGFLCSGCMTGLTLGLYGMRERHNVRLVLTGGGEPEKSFQIKLLSPSASNRGRNKRRLALVGGFVREVTRNPRYLHPGCSTSFAREFYHRYARRFKDLRVVPLFRYIDWDETAIVELITGGLGWENPSHSHSTFRSDCMIHMLRQFLYLGTLGFSKNDEILSGMIRAGQLTRAEALERLRHENVIPEESMGELVADLGLDFARLKTALSSYEPRR